MVVPQHAASALDAPFVFSADGHKSLYFTLDQLQSRMCCAESSRLEVDYTRTMMGFLLFDRQPRHIVMIGLGGGSLLKFCRRHLPDAKSTVIEINPKVVALRQQFEIPEDDHHLSIKCADGADLIHAAGLNPSTRYDVLLVDGFDSRGQAPSLCSQRFYDDCFKALGPQGLMVANLHHDDPNHAVFTGRIRLAFDGNQFEIASQEKSNSVIFARKGERISIDQLRLANPLKYFSPEVQSQLTREFARITWAMTEPSPPST
jgi:spermidine synthase